MCKDTGLAMALYQVRGAVFGSREILIMEIGMMFEQVGCFKDFFFHSVFGEMDSYFSKGLKPPIR